MRIKLPPTQQEMEESDYLVCAKWVHAVPDDCEAGKCSSCGTDVMYAKSMPKKPQRICMDCAVEMMDREVRTGHYNG